MSHGHGIRLTEKIKVFLKGYFTASPPFLIKIFSRLSGALALVPSGILGPPLQRRVSARLPRDDKFTTF